MFDRSVVQQTAGILMGTNCTLLLDYLFLYSSILIFLFNVLLVIVCLFTLILLIIVCLFSLILLIIVCLFTLILLIIVMFVFLPLFC